MNDSERSNDASAVYWTTTIAIATHGIFWALCIAQLWAVPNFIHIFEDFDAALPALTVLIINIYTALGSFWFAIPLLALGLFAADAWIFHRLFRNPSYRVLGVAWFFAVLLITALMTAVIGFALFYPLVELIDKLA